MDGLMADTVVCPVCGYRYESSPAGACGKCPLHPDCAMACCPACGHATINPHKSRLVRWLQRRLRPSGKGLTAPAGLITIDDLYLEPTIAEAAPEAGKLTLDQAAPGSVLQVLGFSSALSVQHRLRLQAFGLEPGRRLRIIQQRPVTIVLIDHLELAVEKVLAQRVLVAQ